MVDLTFTAEKDTSIEQIDALLKKAAVEMFTICSPKIVVCGSKRRTKRGPGFKVLVGQKEKSNGEQVLVGLFSFYMPIVVFYEGSRLELSRSGPVLG